MEINEFEYNIPSRERQIARWNNLKPIIINELKCYICDFKGNIDLFKKYLANDNFNAGLITRHECPNCNLIFGDLRILNMSELEIKNDYDDVYSYFKEANTAPDIVNNINNINIFYDKSLSYLDYACGVGNMIPILKSNGYNIIGYDKYIKNINVVNNIDNLYFDVIYSNNFIEHLINPINDIKEILNHLKIGGYLIFMSDCIDEYKNENTHFHTFYYTGKSFKILCDKLGLEIIESKNVGSYKIKILKKINNKN